MSRYVRWHRTQHSESTRIAVTLLAGPVFLGLLPFLVAGIGPRLDRSLGLPPLRIGAAGRIIGGVLAAAGFSPASGRSTPSWIEAGARRCR